MCQANLIGLIEDNGEEREGQRDHESNPSCREKRNRLEEPDEGILKFARAGNGGKKD